MVVCGDCKHFIRKGRCGFYSTPEGKRKDRPFGEAPFWVFSDCYSDKEQVYASASSACPVFIGKNGNVLTVNEESGSKHEAR